MSLFGIDLDGDGKADEKDDMLIFAAMAADEEERQSGNNHEEERLSGNNHQGSGGSGSCLTAVLIVPAIALGIALKMKGII